MGLCRFNLRTEQSNSVGTETLQFVFLHSPDGDPVCGVVPLIVGASEDVAKSTCDEIAAYAGGAPVRQDMQMPYTAIQAALQSVRKEVDSIESIVILYLAPCHWMEVSDVDF